jgi:hypothetical protein
VIRGDYILVIAKPNKRIIAKGANEYYDYRRGERRGHVAPPKAEAKEEPHNGILPARFERSQALAAGTGMTMLQPPLRRALYEGSAVRS